MLVLTSAQMRACDAYAIKKLNIPSLVLMENAAKTLLSACLSYENAESFLILTGKGNNGGDGLCLCKMLADSGKKAECITLFGKDNLSEDSKEMAKRLEDNQISDLSELGLEKVTEKIKNADVIVDCIFGTGFSGAVRGSAEAVIKATEGKKVVACDLPSGVCCDSGKVEGACIKADKTVTFCAYKPFAFLYPAKDYSGEIIVGDIDMPTEAIEKQMPYIEATDGKILSLIKTRKENSHKGTFGNLQCICGSKYMTGAAILSAEAAIRSGAGLVHVCADKKTLRILQTALTEPVFQKRKKKVKADAVLVGCGLGKKGKIVKKVLKRNLPTVIDADALNYIAKHKHLLNKLHNNCILTPHPAEMARLLKTSVKEVESDRITIAQDFAKKYGVTLLLKGKHTVIASPTGEIKINTTGNSALAKGGSGDVLAGLTASLLAQGYDTFTAASLGAYLHGKAADVLVEKGESPASIIPSDLPKEIGNLIR